MFHIICLAHNKPASVIHTTPYITRNDVAKFLNYFTHSNSYEIHIWFIIYNKDRNIKILFHHLFLILKILNQVWIRSGVRY